MVNRVIEIDARHRALVIRESEGSIAYELQKLWNQDDWDTEFELSVRFDRCANMRSNTCFHMCNPQEADALSHMIKVCMADADALIGDGRPSQAHDARMQTQDTK